MNDKATALSLILTIRELWNTHRGDQIVEYSKKLLFIDPENEFGLYALIHGYNKTKQFDAMYETCKNALTFYPDSENFHFSMYLYQINTGKDYVEGKTHLFEAMKQNPMNARYHRDMGEIYLINREADKAVKYLQKATELEPSNAEYRSRLALGLLRLHKVSESIKIAEEALREDPDDHQILDTVGFIYILSGKIEQAEELFRDALARFPTYEYYQKHLVMAEKEKIDRENRLSQGLRYTPLYLRQTGTKRFFDEDIK